MSITIIVDKKLKITPAGVYLIKFSNGYFYIGASKCLVTRIMTHKRNIRSGFNQSGCKSMKRMKGKRVRWASFILLEAIISDDRGFGLPQEFIKREKYYKDLYMDRKYLLNLITNVA